MVNWSLVHFLHHRDYGASQHMDAASLLAFGLSIVTEIPSLEASIAAVVKVISGIHSIHDAATAAPVIAENVGKITAAVLANTPQAAPSTQA